MKSQRDPDLTSVALNATIVAIFTTFDLVLTFKMNLADLLFGTYRRDVLGLLLLHPGESFHVRNIARMTARPANTLYRELATLAAAGLLVRSTQGNQVHYRANTDCPIYDELRGILKKRPALPMCCATHCDHSPVIFRPHWFMAPWPAATKVPAATWM